MAVDVIARGLSANETARNRRLAVLQSLRGSMARVGLRMPGLAASLPAIGAPTSASSITTGTLHSPVSHPEKFWLTGGVWGSGGTSFPNSLAVAPVSIHPGNGTDPTIAAQGQGQRTCFVCWAPKLEIYVLYGDVSGGFRLKVDGEYVATGLKGNAGDGTANGLPRYIAVTWGDGSATHRKQRFYELEWASNGKFAGVRTETAYAVHPWRPVDALRVLLHGDSMVNTVSDSSPQALALLPNLGTLSGSLLGQQDVWVSAIGGTGWYANLGAAASTFNQRVALDVVAPAPDVIVELGGKNDQGLSSQTDLQARVESWLTSVLTAKPATIVFMTGPILSRAGEAGTNILAVREAKRAAAAKWPRNVAFIDNIAQGWTTGNGRLGAPLADGNADWCNGTDNTHPSIEGSAHLAGQMARAVAAAIPGLIAVQ